MYYYADLSANDIVLDVLETEETLNGDLYILLSTNDRTIIGKWYDRENSTADNPIFTDVPNWISDYEYHSGKLGKKGYTGGSLDTYLDAMKSTVYAEQTVTITSGSRYIQITNENIQTTTAEPNTVYSVEILSATNALTVTSTIKRNETNNLAFARGNGEATTNDVVITYRVIKTPFTV